ncbi:MAG: FIST N-terminal domain-containing protein [Opitutales bacterium]|jgi:small ligand-binding sensory domain FIST
MSSDSDTSEKNEPLPPLEFAPGHAAAGHLAGPFNEAALVQFASGLRERLTAGAPTLGLIFMGAPFREQAREVLELVRLHARTPLLAGCSSHALVANGREIEGEAGVALVLYHLPGAELHGFHFHARDAEDGDTAGYWVEHSGVTPEKVRGWLVFADPFHMRSDQWLRGWNAAYAPRPILGGLATGRDGEYASQIYLNGEVFDEGGVAVAVGGAVTLAGLVAQGCEPVGETWTITRAEGNVIHEIGRRPAYEVLQETFANLPDEMRKRAQGNIFVGLVVNEYREDFQRGDFLVRNLIGGDPKSGALAVAAFPRTGQTVQFQLRDATAASADLAEHLTQARAELAGRAVYGGCLCVCNGRGTHLFGRPDHDAGLVARALGPLEFAGFFCNGELGPVGKGNFIHGYSAMLALFMQA